ncbi:cytochrome c nitrite reductase(EC:1.7.2.2) [uncultured Gammaproteobacteria bacterium]|nr:cytochrome c nitrite reductase(EC:1.7.2.2) [uncultured Gammaproteobacteria bacterium]
MLGFRKNKKIQSIKLLLKNINWKYLSDEGYFKNSRTNFSKEAYWLHQNEIAKLKRKNNNYKRSVNTTIRRIIVIATTIFVAVFHNLYVSLFVANSDSIFIKITSVGLSGIVMSAPIIFIIWTFRDKNKLLELENARKDTNLKEFQQLQRCATGNMDGNSDNDNKIALQISALHSLRAYLKGEYGESFRRGAYEIFRAILATQHQKILQQLKNSKPKTIRGAIDSCPLTKQLNIIASEEWFNLLINHNFPTKGISLVGVDLSHTYLHHRTYGETLDLQGARLQATDLGSVQLQGVNLEGAQLQGVNLEGAQLQRANFQGARLQGANFQGAQLQKANLQSARLQGANFQGAQLQKANLQSARLQGANFQGAQLQKANLQSARLQGVNLRYAQLQGVDFRYAQLQGASFQGVQLQGADLRYAQLQGICAETHEGLHFEQKIKRQIDKETESQNLEEQYEALNDTDKSQLIAELKAINSVGAVEAISRIQSASETLDLSQAITGKYSQEEANEWLNDYKEAKYDGF